MNRIIDALPKMYTGEELNNMLLSLPEKTEAKGISEKLFALEDIYNIYIPSKMSVEIYCKLYLTTIHSLAKKENARAFLQKNENHKRVLGKKSVGLIGGSDAFTIIGNSGIGKSSAIEKAVNLITGDSIIELENPFIKIIPCLTVQCPFDCSVKGLLYEILRKVDATIGTEYYNSAVKQTATVDMLIGAISQVALNHIGLLIVDEIQNIVKHKNGNMLISMLTQLINSSGISICMVGTPEADLFFERADYLARRAIGLKYTNCQYDSYFEHFCKTLFEYQFTKKKVEITDEYISWLYEHTGGIISNVITLFHDAQEIAVMNDLERIDIPTLNEVYKDRMSSLHTFITPKVDKKLSQPKKSKSIKKSLEPVEVNFTIKDLVDYSKKNETDIIETLKENITVVEVKVS